MKTFCYSLLLSLMLAVLAGPAVAETNLVGTWQGRLEAAPGTTLTIQFVIASKPGGGYTAAVTSLDSDALKNVSAESVTFADSRLTIDVPKLSGGYAGTLRNGVFEGEWSQEGAKLPLSLKPLETQALKRTDIDVLRGEWFGKFTPGSAELTMVLSFSTGTDGALRAVFSVPEQGVKDWETHDVTLDDGHFSVELTKPRARVTGMLKSDQIVGQFHQQGNSFPLTLKKGRYIVPLDLPAAASAQLKGRWSGTLNSLPVIVSFETDASGRTQGFFDSTRQGRKFPITKAALAGTTLTFAVAYGATYKAELAGDKLTGEWTQAGFSKPLPLVLTRGEKSAAAPISQDMTPEAAAPYLGLYWDEQRQRPQIVVLYKSRLAIELPMRTLRELEKTTEEHVWSYVANPENLVKFHRDGAGPATAMELRQNQTATLPRFEPEKGLPSLDELLARRPDFERAKKLGALGILRMSGSIERTTTPAKGSFEVLSSGDERSRTKINLDGAEAHVVVAGNRAWMQPQASSPVQEMPEDMGRATRLAGWLLATGDWRDEFKQARVLKRVDLDGKPVFLVHAAPEKGHQRLVYLDTENGLTLGYDQVFVLPGVGIVGCEVRFADYRDVEGVQIPFKNTVKYTTVTASVPKLGTWTYQVEKIESRLKLDKDPFTIK